jgi:hypothetical protein
MKNPPDNTTFTYLNNQKLSEIIGSARRHLIYAAPSVASSVADSLGVARNDNATVRVVIDADPDAFRLGFGDPDGLALLIDRGIDVRRAAGLRIAVLVADDRAWVYSPTPEIIFEQPNQSVSNAVQVSVDFATQILVSLAPDIVTNTDNDVPSATIIAHDAPEIGIESVTSQDLIEIDKQLKENPPQKFDATRKVRVYQGYFQFVQLSLTGCRLSAHTISIPKILLNIAEDSDLQDRVRSTCRLVDNTSDFAKKVKVIERKVRKLREDHARSLGERYGSVILRKERTEFDKKVTEIQKELATFSAMVKEGLDREIKNSREKLIAMLLPGFMKNPPKRLTSGLFGDLNEVLASEFMGEELDKELPDVDDLIGEMQLNCDYKDVTFEMLNDTDFVKLIQVKFPYNDFNKLYAEEQTIAQRPKA